MKSLSTILSIALILPAQVQTSQNNVRLKGALERYPEADADGDGVLTMEEAKAFRE